MGKKIMEFIFIALTIVVLSVLFFQAIDEEQRIHLSRMEQFFEQEDIMQEYIIQVSNNDR